MPRSSRAPERRRQIVWALFDCLAEKGHEKVTVKDIARKAGLPHGVIHYYFRNKEEIVSTLIGEVQAHYETLLAERLQCSASVRGRVDAAVALLIEEFIFNSRLNRVFYNLVQMSFEQLTVRKALRKMLRAYRERLADLFGETASGNTGIPAAAVTALVEGLALQWMIEPEAVDRETVSRLMGAEVSGRFPAADHPMPPGTADTGTESG